MRISMPVIVATATVACLSCGAARAQSERSTFDLKQPASVHQTAFEYSDYYATDADVASDAQAKSVDAAYTNSGSCDSCNDCDGGCDSCCDSGCGSCYLFGPSDPWSLVNEGDAIDVGGWQEFGYTDAAVGLSVFNRVPHRFNLNQSWLYIGREADGSNGLDFGGRVDMFYGTDGFAGQSFGNNPGRFDFQNGWDHGSYAWAMPQLYGEVAYGDLSVKIGHFWTIIGYEVVGAPGNFFFTHAFTHEAAEPFTHTGALAEYSAGENVTLYGGWTAGYDTGYDRFNGGSNFLGGASFGLTDGIQIAYALGAGNLGSIGDGYSHSIILSGAVTDRVQYVAESDLIQTSTGLDAVGINQYLIYSINDCWGVGGRAEWFKLNGVSLYEMTAGLNYNPHANVRIRPEFRYQWSPGGGLAALGAAENKGIFGIDTFFTY